MPTPAGQAVAEFEATEVPVAQELVEIPPEPETKPAESVDPNRPLRRKK